MDWIFNYIINKILQLELVFCPLWAGSLILVPFFADPFSLKFREKPVALMR